MSWLKPNFCKLYLIELEFWIVRYCQLIFHLKMHFAKITRFLSLLAYRGSKLSPSEKWDVECKNVSFLSKHQLITDELPNFWCSPSSSWYFWENYIVVNKVILSRRNLIVSSGTSCPTYWSNDGYLVRVYKNETLAVRRSTV